MQQSCNAIVSYSVGQFGGVRAAIQLRSFLTEIEMPTISSIFSVPRISKSLNDNGDPQEEPLPQQVVRFLDELEWYEEALQRQRMDKGTPF